MKEQLVRAATFLSDRRHFIGRFAATTAVVMTGGLGLRYRTAGQGVQGDVNTLVPGIRGRQHGITTYRVRQVDSGQRTAVDQPAARWRKEPAREAHRAQPVVIAEWYLNTQTAVLAE